MLLDEQLEGLRVHLAFEGARCFFGFFTELRLGEFRV